MKTFTKSYFIFLYASLPLGWVQPADFRLQGTVSQTLSQRSPQGTVIHDKDVKAFLAANGLDLEALWEKQFPQDVPDGIMQSIASILGFRSSVRNPGIDPVKTALLESNFDDEQRACLAGRLTTIRKRIHAALQNPTPVPSNPFSVLLIEGDQDLQDELTFALLEYFRLENILARAAKGDGYILDLPSTPLMIVSNKSNRILSLARLKQEVQNYESAPTRIDRLRCELFNNHRYDGSDPHWSEEATEQRKKLHSRIILGSMALGWCSNAYGYKLHYDMVKAQREEKLASNTEATEHFKAESETAAVDTPKVENNNAPVIHKRARTHTFSWGSPTSEPETKEQAKTPASSAYTSYTQKDRSICSAKTRLLFEDLPPNICPRSLPTLFDNRNNHNPQKYDQSYDPICGAFAARRLIEEQLNRWHKENGEENEYICMNLFDLIHKFGTYKYCLDDYPISTYQILVQAIRDGACREGDGVAYFNPEEKEIFNTHLHEMAQNSTNNKPVNEAILFPRQGTVRIDTKLTDAVKSAGSAFPYKKTLGETLRELAKSQPGAGDGFVNTLTTEKCQANRITRPFLGLHVAYRRLGRNHILKGDKDPNLLIEERIRYINEALESGNSLALRICARDFLENGDPGECGGHFVVLAAVRYNDESGESEGYVINSWGDSQDLSGWQNYRKLLQHVNGIEYFRGKSETTPGLLWVDDRIAYYR